MRRLRLSHAPQRSSFPISGTGEPPGFRILPGGDWDAPRQDSPQRQHRQDGAMRTSATTVTVLTALLVTAAAAFGFPAPARVNPGPRATKPCGQEQAGYVVVPCRSAQNCTRLAVERYFPQPGDILLYDNCSKALNL